MRHEIAEEVEMLGKARVGQHLPAIAADREHPARFDMVVAVEFEHALLPRNRPAIADRLSVILALAFQQVELEQTIRRRMEGDTLSPMPSGRLVTRRGSRKPEDLASARKSPQ